MRSKKQTRGRKSTRTKVVTRARRSTHAATPLLAERSGRLVPVLGASAVIGLMTALLIAGPSLQQAEIAIVSQPREDAAAHVLPVEAASASASSLAAVMPGTATPPDLVSTAGATRPTPTRRPWRRGVLPETPRWPSGAGR